MKALLQRVSEARVRVDNQTVGEIEAGLLVFLCAEPKDTEDTGERLLRKLLAMRIFTDKAGKMNLSLLDTRGQLLVVSQFTLAADTTRGNRPSFTGAAHPALASALYDAFVRRARLTRLKVETGVFGADMQVTLVNDGPVTIPLCLR